MRGHYNIQIIYRTFLIDLSFDENKKQFVRKNIIYYDVSIVEYRAELYSRLETRKRKMESSENAKQSLTYPENLKVHAIFLHLIILSGHVIQKRKEELENFT